jgi:hypothetical protein
MSRSRVDGDSDGLHDGLFGARAVSRGNDTGGRRLLCGDAMVSGDRQDSKHETEFSHRMAFVTHRTT